MEKEIANDYSKYLAVDYTNRFDTITRQTNEMLARMAEFDLIIRMAHKRTATELNDTVIDVSLLKDKVSEVCKRIENLEKFVNDVEANLDGLESFLTSAESDLGSPGSLKTFLKPLSLFGNANKPVDPVNTSPTVFVPINTSGYFPHNVEQGEEVLQLKSFSSSSDNIIDEAASLEGQSYTHDSPISPSDSQATSSNSQASLQSPLSENIEDM